MEPVGPSVGRGGGGAACRQAWEPWGGPWRTGQAGGSKGLWESVGCLQEVDCLGVVIAHELLQEMVGTRAGTCTGGVWVEKAKVPARCPEALLWAFPDGEAPSVLLVLVSVRPGGCAEHWVLEYSVFFLHWNSVVDLCKNTFSFWK